MPPQGVMQAGRPQIVSYEMYLFILIVQDNVALSMIRKANNAESSTMRAHMHDLFHDSKISLRVMTGLTS